MPKALIIDDDPDLLAVLAAAFRQAGLATWTSDNGRAGLCLFDTVRPDLVVTDIIMPETEGIGLILALRRRPDPPRVIAISGGGRFGWETTLTWARLLGADLAVPKPFRPPQLAQLALALLDGSEPRAELAQAKSETLQRRCMR